MSRLVRLAADRHGQMTVELAVVLPVVLVVMVIAIDLLAYMGECARFDHLAPQAVLAQGVSTQEADTGDASALVLAALQEQFTMDNEEVAVETSGSWGLVTYHCTLEVAPWPLGSGGVSLFGLHIPTSLTHVTSFVVDPYKTGRY